MVFIKSQFGFTLIELLISIAILAIIAGVGGDLVITSIRSYNKSQVINTLSQNGGFALSTIKNEVQSSLFLENCTATNLGITNKDGGVTIYDLSPVLITDCSSGNGHLTRGSDYLLNTELSSGTVRVLSGSRFDCEGNLVTITLVLGQSCNSSTRIDSTATTTLKTSVVIRGGYR